MSWRCSANLNYPPHLPRGLFFKNLICTLVNGSHCLNPWPGCSKITTAELHFCLFSILPFFISCSCREGLFLWRVSSIRGHCLFVNNWFPLFCYPRLVKWMTNNLCNPDDTECNACWHAQSKHAWILYLSLAQTSSSSNLLGCMLARPVDGSARGLGDNPMISTGPTTNLRTGVKTCT